MLIIVSDSVCDDDSISCIHTNNWSVIYSYAQKSTNNINNTKLNLCKQLSIYKVVVIIVKWEEVQTDAQ